MKSCKLVILTMVDIFFQISFSVETSVVLMFLKAIIIIFDGMVTEEVI